ncbi:hypothetical protein AB9N12_12490 [Bacteroides sp. AN502(2024)]|uniref:hypothetical protein n=1 Tax=Bacteroides sp. AN502(2024) TaxID=3160599 RepID=UPI0035187411
MKYIWIMCLLLVCGCNTIKEDAVINEEYEKLFPPKEIEKPENKRGELPVELCDPDLALKSYKYPGTETPDDAEEYTVTLSCSFAEIDRSGYFVSDVTAQYEVRYINEKKELVTVRCAKNRDESDEGDSEEAEYADDSSGSGNVSSNGSTAPMMQNGEWLEITFKVHSGFPMYLCVTGVGPRDSNVKASIKAMSADGLIEIPELKSEQYQNEEGPNMLKHPYCEYIILP